MYVCKRRKQNDNARLDVNRRKELSAMAGNAGAKNLRMSAVSECFVFSGGKTPTSFPGHAQVA